jgi:hypothetical protein
LTPRGEYSTSAIRARRPRTLTGAPLAPEVERAADGYKAFQPRRATAARRRARAPRPPKPISIRAQAAGSGAATLST